MRILAAVLIPVTWVGSLSFGWGHEPWWLVAIFFGYLIVAGSLACRSLMAFGSSGELTRFLMSTVSPAFAFMIWNVVISVAIFGLAWEASSYL
jgi:hypothetical protein